MRDPWIWSVSLGRWWNVQVRLHLFFLLFGVFTLYVSSIPYLGQPNWLGVSCVLTLLVSVMLHEVGHVAVARRLGGLADEVVIGPLGGLSQARVPYEPHSELVALMAGPLVNVGICLVTAICLMFYPGINLIGLLHPLFPAQITAGTPLLVALKLTFWINWLLLLFNLLPVYPFDGGAALRAVLTFLWPELDTQQSLTTVARLGKVLAALLLVAAWLMMDQEPGQWQVDAADKYPTIRVPPWFVLTLLSIFVFFSARREERQFSEIEANEDDVFGYDFSQGYTSLERSIESGGDAAPKSISREGAFARWWKKRREARQRQLRKQEADDEKRVDEVLSRLHEGGLDSLSREDRELLQRVSQRYRSRQS